MWVGEEGWSPMTETIKGMTSMPEEAKKACQPGCGEAGCGAGAGQGWSGLPALVVRT